CQHRRAACRNVLGLKRRLTFAFDGDQHVPFFRPLVRRLRQDRAAESEIKAKDRCDREKIAARGGIDIRAIAAATPAFLDLAHHSSPTGASNGLHSSYYSKSLRSSPQGPKHQSARENERRDAAPRPCRNAGMRCARSVGDPPCRKPITRVVDGCARAA